MRNALLKLSPGYLGLWLALWLILALKIYLIREATLGDLHELLILGPAMLAAAYLGGLVAWRINDRKQLAGEIGYLAVLAAIFVVRTILLYREALAMGEV